jgi:hypothetical protein
LANPIRKLREFTAGGVDESPHADISNEVKNSQKNRILIPNNTEKADESFFVGFQQVTFDKIIRIRGMALRENRNCQGWLIQFVCVIWLASTGTIFGQVQPTNCATVKEGKFEIEDSENGGVWMITRKAGVQREENESAGISVEYLIEYIDDCTFRLLPYNIIRNDARLELGGDAKFIVEIVEILDDTYIQETTVWKTGQYISAEVKIIR